MIPWRSSGRVVSKAAEYHDCATANLAWRVDDPGADGDVLLPEEPLVDLQRIVGRFHRFVNLERSVLRILGHSHVYELHNFPLFIDECDGQRDQGVLHPKGPQDGCLEDE